MSDSSNLFIVFLAEVYLLKVGNDAFFLYTFWDDRITSVNSPCDEDLCRRSVEFLRDVLDDGMFREQWLVAHCNNISICFLYNEKWALTVISQ